MNAEADVQATVERIERALRASREFLNKLPLSDGASGRAVDREFITVDLIPGALTDIDELAAAVRAGGEAAAALRALTDEVFDDGATAPFAAATSAFHTGDYHGWVNDETAAWLCWAVVRIHERLGEALASLEPAEAGQAADEETT